MKNKTATNIDLPHRTYAKKQPIESSKLRKAAEGQACTLNIAGVCNYRPDTSVLCHLPDETHGMSQKSDDLSSAIGCSSCHDVIDGRVKYDWQPGEKEFYMRRAQVRTLKVFQDMGLIKIL